MKISFKNASRYAWSSIIFALIYTIMLKIKVGMDIMVFLRVTCILMLIFFALTMAIDIASQVIKRYVGKK